MVELVQVLAPAHVLQHTVVPVVQYVRFAEFIDSFSNLLLYIAVCSPACLNGGTCSSPGTCTCPSTYSGTRCTIRKI